MTMIDETYKKMILALQKPFFDGWKLEAGDKVIANGDKIYTLLGGNSIGIFGIDPDKHLFSIGELQFSTKIGSKYIPIPSQRQIQDILLKSISENKGESNDSHLQEMFCRWTITFKWSLVNSFECMWLQFLMFYKYNKQWNGEEWM